MSSSDTGNTTAVVSKVYLARYSGSHGDMAGEVVDANRVFCSLEDARAFAKVSAQAYASRYYGGYSNPFKNAKEREDGKYFIHTEENGFTFYAHEYPLEEPVEIPSQDGKVFSIVEDSKIRKILFHHNRSRAITEARKFAKELSNEEPYNICSHVDLFDGDTIRVVSGCDSKHHRATYTLKLETKKKEENDDDDDECEEEDDEWWPQTVTHVEVVYTDIGPFKATDGLDEAALNSEVAHNWLKFMGGEFDLLNVLQTHR